LAWELGPKLKKKTTLWGRVREVKFNYQGKHSSKHKKSSNESRPAWPDGRREVRTQNEPSENPARGNLRGGGGNVKESLGLKTFNLERGTSFNFKIKKKKGKYSFCDSTIRRGKRENSKTKSSERRLKKLGRWEGRNQNGSEFAGELEDSRGSRT